MNFKDIAALTIEKFLYVIYYCFWCGRRIIRIDKNKILLSNFNGLGFGDNVKAVAEQIHSEEPYIRIYWLLKNKNLQLPEWITPVYYYSILSVYHAFTSSVWVSNARLPHFWRKRTGQLYIQTWHGGIALKKIEKDAEDNLSIEYIRRAKNDSKMIDYLVSNGDICTKMYKRAFWYSGKILEIGSPRCDYMINNPTGDGRVHRYFSVSSNIVIVLYAPTFRKTLCDYLIDYENLYKCLKNKYDTEVKIVVRYHPIVAKCLNVPEADYILNGNNYPDMYELLTESDLLITDYSSTMFEMSAIKKKVILYVTDIDEYKNDRGFYFNLFELPFPIARNSSELISIIECFNYEKYINDLRLFMAKLGLKEPGTASASLCDIIFQHMKNSK